MSIDPSLLSCGEYPVPELLTVTWNHIYAVTAVSSLAGMLGGGAIMYLRLYLNGDLVGREPRFQRRRRGGDQEDPEDDEEEMDIEDEE